MPTIMNPYLSFKDGTSEAIDFYQTVFGGKVTKSTFKEGGMPHDPAEADKIMHSQLVTDNGITLMAADMPTDMAGGEPSNGSISLSGDDEAELRGYFEKLSDGGVVTMPMEKAPWGDVFGMCVDKFGVKWMANVNGAGGTDAG